MILAGLLVADLDSCVSARLEDSCDGRVHQPLMHCLVGDCLAGEGIVLVVDCVVWGGFVAYLEDWDVRDIVPDEVSDLTVRLLEAQCIREAVDDDSLMPQATRGNDVDWTRRGIVRSQRPYRG